MNANLNEQPSRGCMDVPGESRYVVQGRTYRYRRYLSSIGLMWDSSVYGWSGRLSEGRAWYIREKLGPLVQKECPFQVMPETNAPATWVRPELVCEVALSGWTGDNVMRQPVFLRLREEKDAREVVREKPEGETDT